MIPYLHDCRHLLQGPRVALEAEHQQPPQRLPHSETPVNHRHRLADLPARVLCSQRAGAGSAMCERSNASMLLESPANDGTSARPDQGVEK